MCANIGFMLYTAFCFTLIGGITNKNAERIDILSFRVLYFKEFIMSSLVV